MQLCDIVTYCDVTELKAGLLQSFLWEGGTSVGMKLDLSRHFTCTGT